jgi:hypothetical protein
VLKYDCICAYSDVNPFSVWCVLRCIVKFRVEKGRSTKNWPPISLNLNHLDCLLPSILSSDVCFCFCFGAQSRCFQVASFHTAPPAHYVSIFFSKPEVFSHSTHPLPSRFPGQRTQYDGFHALDMLVSPSISGISS